MKVVGVVLLGVLMAGCVAMQGTPKRASDDEIAKINLRLGIEYVRQGEYAYALENLNKTVKLQPENGVAYGMLGVVYTQLGEPGKANDAYQNALVMVEPNSKDYAVIQNNYGGFLCDRGNFEDAERHFLRALESPGSTSIATTYENIGLCAKRHKLTAKAEQYFRLALKHDATLPRSLLGMAEIMLDAAKALSARAYIQRYHAQVEESAASLWLGVRIESALNDQRAAEQYAQSLRAKFPMSSEAEHLQAQQNSESR